MCKLLWKALLVSPAVVGATLMISMGAGRAADSASVPATDNLTLTEVAQPQAAGETQNLESQSQSTVNVPTLAASAEAGVNSNQLLQASPTEETSIPAAVTPVANPTVAQVTPADPSNVDVLNQINRYSREGNSNVNVQDQVTNVTQLSDVRPTDWAYEALRSLVERYGCIAGYPDGTYRGNRALSRYEFAAGLNACLQQIERLITERTTGFVTKADLETLQRLIDEFRTELATLGTRVDKLEGRVAFLEDRQFSTTTKLAGEAIFAITDEFNQDLSNNTVFQDRVRLTFNTSFTGRDRLVTRLAASNAQLFSTSAGSILNEGQQTFNITGGSSGNDVVLDWLAYYFNFGSSKVYLAATGGIHSDYAPTLNPYFEDYDGGNGALSTFASENPIYRIGGGAGAAVSFGVGPLESILGPSTLTIGYLAGSGAFGANNPAEKAGLFDGDYAALGQLNFNLGDRIGVGATYVHGYHNSGTAIFDLGGSSQVAFDNAGNAIGGFGVVGSFAANNPSAFLSQLGNNRGLTPVVTNSYGGEIAFRLSDNISISGFGTYTNAILVGQGSADIWTYGGGVAISDFGTPGSVLGLFAGVEPTLRGASNSIRPAAGFSRDNVWHFEGFYKYKLTENISVTPGVIWITAPGQNKDNDDAVIGTLRTTFTF